MHTIEEDCATTDCHEMKLGQVYVCEDCGLELQVDKECDECGKPAEECVCTEHCIFQCCGKSLALKA